VYTFPLSGYSSCPNSGASVEFTDKEDKMRQKTLWRGVRVGLLGVALATPAHAQKPIIGYKGSDNTAAVSGAAAGAAGVVAIITVVLTHKKRITGCVNALYEGMSITDEHDKQTYELMGSTTEFKAGERVSVQVKKIKSKDNAIAPMWRVEKLIKDYGSCN
jgi:hypothetical protein